MGRVINMAKYCHPIPRWVWDHDILVTHLLPKGFNAELAKALGIDECDPAIGHAAALRRIFGIQVEDLGCGLDQEQMVRDIADYPLGSDPMVAASRSPELVGMQIRHTESGYWIPNHRFLIRGFMWVLFQLKVAGSSTLARTNACTVYSLIAYAVRQQTSN